MGPLFIVLLVWGLMCWGVAALAGSRGRSGFGFFLLSFISSPLLGLIAVLIMKDLTEEAAKESESQKEEERREADRKRDHEKQLESLRAVTTNQTNHTSGLVLAPVVTLSIADELTKLAALREKGILLPEEFEQQKKQLLARTVEPTYVAGETIKSFAPSTVVQAAQPTAQQVDDVQQMEQLGITFDGTQYFYGTYRHEQLANVIIFAKLGRAR